MTETRILVVDDEESIRHMLSVLLQKEGYRVRTAPDADGALKEILAAPFDVVLCDVRMPGRTGIELLGDLRVRGIDTTVVIMSAYGDIDSAMDAIKAGAWDFLPKPFRREEVLLTLRKAEERRRLREENEHLRRAARTGAPVAGILSRAPGMLRILETVRKVADYRTTVLLSGESGTGKEMIARALHQESNRREAPFVTVNCGAIPEALLESELFGHVRGAFTDASRDKKGLFEEAEGGTLFLDEIGDLPLALQVKLLRVLQESEIRRVGDTRTRRVDVRVVAASHHDLHQLVREGRFREDLFYRLNVLPIHLPPLRERREDIPLLVEHFVRRCNLAMNTHVHVVSPRAMARLTEYDWPGNVRELENVIERAIVLADSDQIGEENLPEYVRASGLSARGLLHPDDLSVKRATRALEIELIRRALERTGGNRTAAARLLELSHRALLYKIKEYFPEGI